MKPIPSVLPGLDVCEYLPHIAGMTDRITVVRSITHPYPIHGVAFATTEFRRSTWRWNWLRSTCGTIRISVRSCNISNATSDGRPAGDIPQNVALPFPFSSQRVGEVSRAGPYAAFLGSTYNPTWTEYLGQSTRSVQKTLRDMKVDVHDPYVACDADSHFRFSSTVPLPDVTIDRLNRRRTLLEQFDENRRELRSERSTAVRCRAIRTWPFR